jgi:hypothetical protein
VRAVRSLPSAASLDHIDSITAAPPDSYGQPDRHGPSSTPFTKQRCCSEGCCLVGLEIIEGPFTPVEGLFTVLMCPACLAARARGRGPYPDLTDEEMRAGLDLLPTWALEQKAAALSVPVCGRMILGGFEAVYEASKRKAPCAGRRKRALMSRGPWVVPGARVPAVRTGSHGRTRSAPGPPYGW